MTSAVDLLQAELERSGEPVTRVETHVSTLLFRGGHVWKVKRPVHFEFIDLSTPERRREVCHREVELNSRMAPDVYEGVVDVVDAAGTVVDCAVLMKRMPDERRLSTLVRAGTAGDACIDGVARAVVALHEAAARGPRIDEVATPLAVEHLWQRSTEDLRRFVPSLLSGEDYERLRSLEHHWIAGRHELLLGRIAAGHIVDGHGDLLADDIFCLDDGPRVLDCLEFDDLLRYGDVLQDLAFLVMDLERLGRADLGEVLVDRYVELSGEHHPRSLLHFWVAYRALVRAKIAALRHEQLPDSDEHGRDAAAEQCRSLFALALGRLRRARVDLVVVGGLPGTGKSTVAEAVAEAIGAVVLSSDRVRKELTGTTGTSAAASFGAGIYASATTADTYEELMRRAAVLLRHGESVVLDASFGEEHFRVAARGVAFDCVAHLTELRTVCDRVTSDRRLLSRPHDGSHPSDASPAVAAAMAGRAAPWPEAVAVDTEGPPEASVAAALAALAR